MEQSRREQWNAGKPYFHVGVPFVAAGGANTVPAKRLRDLFDHNLAWPAGPCSGTAAVRTCTAGIRARSAVTVVLGHDGHLMLAQTANTSADGPKAGSDTIEAELAAD